VITGRFTAQEANDLGVQLRVELYQVPVESKTARLVPHRDEIASNAVFTPVLVACFLGHDLLGGLLS